MSRFGPEKVPGFVYYFFMKLFCNSLLEDPSSILHHCRHHCHGQHHKAEGDAVDAEEGEVVAFDVIHQEVDSRQTDHEGTTQPTASTATSVPVMATPETANLSTLSRDAPP